jgi:thiol-disulfide isomerase/thioredoxin
MKLKMIALFVCLTFTGVGMAAEVSPGTKPAAAPATKASTQPAVISPAAQAELEKIKEAYAKLNSLDLTGKLSMRFDVMGQKQTKDAEFTSSYQSPNKFRQEVKDDMVAGSTGEKLYLYSKEKNIYLMHDAPKGKVAPGEMPDPFNEVVGTQNPSLIMALSSDAGKSLTEQMSSGEQLADVKLDDKSYTALKFHDPESKASMTLLVDPGTHLVRRATLDMSEALKKRGASDVKSAQVQVDYSKVLPDAQVAAGAFAWDPPKDAKDASKLAESGSGGGSEPAKELVGKPAPDFSAKNLKDETGKVVILDFWATWCPPCVEGLPHVDKVYQELKDKGVEAFAVDVQETKDKVQAFMEEKKLTLTALLDSDGSVSKAYKVEGIPQTVVIGKDGVVKNVFVGSGPGTEEQLRKAVQAALDAK